jgi:hypothetical protein
MQQQLNPQIYAAPKSRPQTITPAHVCHYKKRYSHSLLTATHQVPLGLLQQGKAPPAHMLMWWLSHLIRIRSFTVLMITDLPVWLTHIAYRVEDIFSAEIGYRAIGGVGAACLSGNRKTFDSISLIQKALDNAAGFLSAARASFRSYVRNLP